MSMATQTPFLDAILKANRAEIRFTDDVQRLAAEGQLALARRLSERYQDFITRELGGPT